jgi:hypothetical protein
MGGSYFSSFVLAIIVVLHRKYPNSFKFAKYVFIHRVSLLSCPSSQQVSRDVLADASCLCDKTFVLRHIRKWTAYGVNLELQQPFDR